MNPLALAIRLPDIQQVIADQEHFVSTPICLGLFELPQGCADMRDFGMTHYAKYIAYARVEYDGVVHWQGIAECGYFYTPRHTVRLNPYHKHTLTVTPQGWTCGYN